MPTEGLLYLNQLTLITRRKISMEHRSSIKIAMQGRYVLLGNAHWELFILLVTKLFF